MLVGMHHTTLCTHTSATAWSGETAGKMDDGKGRQAQGQVGDAAALTLVHFLHF